MPNRRYLISEVHIDYSVTKSFQIHYSCQCQKKATDRNLKPSWMEITTYAPSFPLHSTKQPFFPTVRLSDADLVVLRTAFVFARSWENASQEELSRSFLSFSWRDENGKKCPGSGPEGLLSSKTGRVNELKRNHSENISAREQQTRPRCE